MPRTVTRVAGSLALLALLFGTYYGAYRATLESPAFPRIGSALDEAMYSTIGPGAKYRTDN